MINYEDKVLEYIDYGRLSYVSEHKIFTRFLMECLESEELLLKREQKELRDVLAVALDRLEDDSIDIEAYKTLCWEKHYDYCDEKQRLSAYYRVLVLLFYEFTDDVDQTSQFTEIGLFLDCVKELWS